MLAQWIFVHPSAARQADTWIRAHIAGCKARGIAGGVLLEDHGVQQLRTALGGDNKGRSLLQVKYQQHGQLVHIPPGWLHQVRNLSDNVKVAFEFAEPSRFSMYMCSQRYISSSVTNLALGNEPDYMRLLTLLDNAMLHLRCKN